MLPSGTTTFIMSNPSTMTLGFEGDKCIVTITGQNVQHDPTTGLFAASKAMSPSSTQVGTTVTPFNAITGTDTNKSMYGVTFQINTKNQCITCMKEYEDKSLEELRREDYIMDRKGSSMDIFGGSLNATLPQGQPGDVGFRIAGRADTTPAPCPTPPTSAPDPTPPTPGPTNLNRPTTCIGAGVSGSPSSPFFNFGGIPSRTAHPNSGPVGPNIFASNATPSQPQRNNNRRNNKRTTSAGLGSSISSSQALFGNASGAPPGMNVFGSSGQALPNFRFSPTKPPIPTQIPLSFGSAQPQHNNNTPNNSPFSSAGFGTSSSSSQPRFGCASGTPSGMNVFGSSCPNLSFGPPPPLTPSFCFGPASGFAPGQPQNKYNAANYNSFSGAGFGASASSSPTFFESAMTTPGTGYSAFNVEPPPPQPFTFNTQQRQQNSATVFSPFCSPTIPSSQPSIFDDPGSGTQCFNLANPVNPINFGYNGASTLFGGGPVTIGATTAAQGTPFNFVNPVNPINLKYNRTLFCGGPTSLGATTAASGNHVYLHGEIQLQPQQPTPGHLIPPTTTPSLFPGGSTKPTTGGTDSGPAVLGTTSQLGTGKGDFPSPFDKGSDNQ